MESQKKKPFHITITNNETGEVLRDDDTQAIIASWDADKQHTQGCILLKGSGKVLTATIAGAVQNLKTLEKENPLEYLLAQMVLKEAAKDAEAQKDNAEE